MGFEVNSAWYGNHKRRRVVMVDYVVVEKAFEIMERAVFG
jgi:hypothetical protein